MVLLLILFLIRIFFYCCYAYIYVFINVYRPSYFTHLFYNRIDLGSTILRQI